LRRVKKEGRCEPAMMASCVGVLRCFIRWASDASPSRAASGERTEGACAVPVA
jgi:hypothetical protein